MAVWYRFETSNSEVLLDLDELISLWKGQNDDEMVVHCLGMDPITVVCDFDEFVIDWITHHDARPRVRPLKAKRADQTPAVSLHATRG